MTILLTLFLVVVFWFALYAWVSHGFSKARTLLKIKAREPVNLLRLMHTDLDLYYKVQMRLTIALFVSINVPFIAHGTAGLMV